MKKLLNIECPGDSGWTSPASAYKVPAVRSIRELTGWGLKEAKDFVETPGTTQVEVLPTVTDEALMRCTAELTKYGMKVVNASSAMTLVVHQALEIALQNGDYCAVAELAEFLKRRS